ncbi:MAG TPA: ORF6N domain-containing protein [Chitinophaga sp.]
MELITIQNRIYEVRGQKVMLDFDLAELYEVETRAFNQAVKRNIARFPDDFMFQLTKKEWDEILSVNTVASSLKHRGSAYLPYAFTEHGVTMVASILRSDKAVKMNISIVRAFIALREMAMHYKELAQKIEELEKKYNKQFGDVYQALNLLLEEKNDEEEQKNREPIGFIKPGKK